jgi:hypothetical protein
MKTSEVAIYIYYIVIVNLITYYYLQKEIEVTFLADGARTNWRRFLQEDAPRMQEDIRKGSPGKDFTILLKGSRLDLIQQSLDTHSRCSLVREIQVDFDGSENLLETLLSHNVFQLVCNRFGQSTMSFLKLCLFRLHIV